MFTTPCFIRKNTSYLRNYLEKLGYVKTLLGRRDTDNVIVALDEYQNINDKNTIARYISLTFRPEQTIRFESTCYSEKDFIDCGTNEKLFLAIAALRDDTDMHQWFVADKEIHWGGDNKSITPIGGFIFSLIDNYSKIDKDVHKVTIEELINHFN